MMTWMVLLIISLMPNPIDVYSERLGDVNPADPYVFVNHSLILNCTLKNGNSSSLFFEYNDTILKEHVTRIDNKTLQLKKPVQSINEAGIYICFLQTGQVKYYVGSQDVQVEYEPHSVDNISCKVFNWDEGMYCSWDIGIYVNQQDLSVAVTYYVFRDQTIRMCPHSGKTFCYWDSDNYRGAYLYAINVTVMNVKTNISYASPIHYAYTRNIVQPASVTDLEEVSKNTSCVDVSWSHSKKETRPLIYRIMKKSLGTHNWQIVSDELPKTTEHFTVCHLQPFSRYVLTVDCYPKHKGFWSNKTKIEVTTAEDVPGSGPVVSVGSFMRQPPAYSCEHGLQNVTIFWQDDFEKNGFISGYKIEFDGQSEKITGNVTMYTISMLHCNITHRVHIYAETLAGISKTYSEILIPQIDKAPRGPKRFWIEIDDITKQNPNQHDVHAVWEITSPSVSSYTVYWCIGSQAIFCKDAIKWKKVGNVTSTVLPIPRHVAYSYIYGLSSETGNFSSGIVWKSCIVLKNTKPTEPPKDVKIVERMDGLTVSWPSDWCLTDEMVLVQKYRIYYCPVSQCPDGTMNMPADTEINKVTLKNLKWDVNYSIQVQAVAEAGAGPLSSPVYGIPIKTSNPFPLLLILAIPIGVVVAVLFFTCLWYNRKKVCSKITVSYPKAWNRNMLQVNGVILTAPSEPGSPVHLLQAIPQTSLDCSNTTQITTVLNDISEVLERDIVVKDSGRGSLPSSQLTKTKEPESDQEDVLHLVIKDGYAEIQLQTNGHLRSSEHQRFSVCENNAASDLQTNGHLRSSQHQRFSVCENNAASDLQTNGHLMSSEHQRFSVCENNAASDLQTNGHLRSGEHQRFSVCENNATSEYVTPTWIDDI